jgi:hypothetical protein
MDSSRPTRILVVANRTAATPRLLDEIRRRALAGPCEFALLIPDRGDRKPADWTFASALPALRRAAGGRVGSIAAGPHPLASVENAVRHGHFDEIIVSTHAERVARWLRRDFGRRIERLGLPVTAIVPKGATVSNKEAARMMIDFGGPG